MECICEEAEVERNLVIFTFYNIVNCFSLNRRAHLKICIKDMKNVFEKSDLLNIRRLIFDFVEKATVYSDHFEVIFKLQGSLNPEIVKPVLCKTVSKTMDSIVFNHSA